MTVCLQIPTLLTIMQPSITKVGRIRGKYIVDQLKLADAKAGTTYNIELFTGDPGDNNAQLFWKGAIRYTSAVH